jgi:hypothetical protein
MSENPDDARGEPVAESSLPPESTSLDELVEAELDDAENVLVLGPMSRSRDEATCGSFFRAAPVSERNVLFVSLTQSADERMAVLRAHTDDLPPKVSIVSGTDGYDSETTLQAGETSIAVDTISDPSDLPKLGITISRAVSSWAEDGRGAVVCFHSLTALLQYVDRQRVFRFLHVLQDRLGSVDAVTHYHMDSEAHDQQTLATVRPLFDAVVEVDPDGGADLVG